MRTLIIALLAGATLASPLAAQDRPDRPDHPEHDRAQRGERQQQQQQQQQPQAAARPAPVPGATGDPAQRDGRAARGGGSERYRSRPDGAGTPGAVATGQRDQGYRADQRPDRGPGGQRDARYPGGTPGGQRDLGYRGDPRGNAAPGAVRDYGDRDARGDQRGQRDYGQRDYGQRDYGQRDNSQRGEQRAGLTGGRSGGQWDRGWRSDRRFDWQSRRQSDRARFHGPRYAPPRGYAYGYRRWSVGIRLAPLFFDSGYWLGDTAYYGLPPAYGPYRWVRYYDDVLLVDLRSGAVVDAIYGFFW